MGGRGRRISEFEASLVYRMNSEIARAIERNPVSKNKTKQNKTKTKTKTKIKHSNNNNKKEFVLLPGMVAHTFNPSTWEADAGGFLSLRPAWSTK